MSKKTFSLWLIFSFILLFTLSQFSNSSARSQKEIKTEQLQFEVGAAFGDRDIFEFIVKEEGTITVEASWEGDAPQLALILNGPTRSEFARKDGSSPLRVSHTVTQKILTKGTNWKVSIVNFSRRGSARGTVKIAYPSEEKIAPLIKVIPKKPTPPAKLPKKEEKVPTKVPGLRIRPLIPQLVRLEIPKTDEFPFIISKEQVFYYHDFRTDNSGNISVEVSWSGEGRLEAFLLPPGSKPEPVARDEGEKILRLQAKITPELMREGNKWTVWVHLPENGQMKKDLRKIIRPEVLTGPPIQGTLKVTYPALLKLRPSPYVPLVIGWMRQALNGKGPRKWLDFLEKNPQFAPVFRRVVTIYDNLPRTEKEKLYAGPFLEKAPEVLIEPDILASAFERQILQYVKDRIRIEPEIRKAEPKIHSIYPEDPKPGRGVLFIGENLTFPERPTIVVLYRQEDGGPRRIIPLRLGESLWILPNVVCVKIPDTLAAVGTYELTLGHPGGSTQVRFEVYPPVHMTQLYTGRFTKVKCIDESDPETILWVGNPSDEVYMIIQVLRAEYPEVMDWQIKTSTMSGFDDGTTKNVNWPFFDKEGRPKTLGNGVIVTVILIEDDVGAPPEEIQDILHFIVEEAVEYGVLWATTELGIPFGDVLAQWAADIVGAVLDLVFAALEDDPLGVQYFQFDAQMLYRLVQDGGGSHADILSYLNDDDTGSYQVTYRWEKR